MWRECSHTREQQELISARCFVAEVMAVRLTLLDFGICWYNHRKIWGRTYVKQGVMIFRGRGLNGGKGKSINMFYRLLHWLNCHFV